MEDQHYTPTSSTSPMVDSESALQAFRDRSDLLDHRLSALQDLINAIRSDIQTHSTESLQKLAEAARNMTNGQVYQKIDMQAKGELGALVESLNTTMANLQQLDASIKHQSTQVPELAAQLDAITADTETATQTVMNRLDALMNAASEGGAGLDEVARALESKKVQQATFHDQIQAFAQRAYDGESQQVVAQEILDYVYAQRLTTQPLSVDVKKTQSHMKVISDEAFEILNTLQFQDITRQKVEKIVMLLKQFQQGLQRLLHIFKIEGGEATTTEVFEHRTVATQDNIFETHLVMDQKKESVEDIIAQFKKAQA